MISGGRRFILWAVVSAVLLGGGAGIGAAAELISTHNDWKAFRHGAGGDRLCFAVSEASEVNPSGSGRSKPHVYITAWPGAGIKTEISILAGAELKADSEVSVEVGGASFKLFADGDRAFVGDGNDEAKLLDAMRRGSSMTVSGTAASGQALSDTYSLSGVTASVQAVASGCN